MRTDYTSVAVLGAGHGGMALAGYFALRGHRVALWNRTSERLTTIGQQGGLHLTTPDEKTAFAPVTATPSIEEAIGSARRILVALPASGHAEVARQCAPYLRDGQSVLLVPGRTGGSLEFLRVLREQGCRARVLLGETNTFPFASRCIGPAEARIFGIKAEITAAALPTARTAELIETWGNLLPMLGAAESVLQTGLSNLGAILHPVITLLNADRIRAKDSFDFYTDGVTSSVAAALTIADEERLRVAAAYGVAVESLSEWIASAYNHRAGTIKEAVGGNPSYRGIKAPTTLVHRYLLEDVPTGLIPLIELGEAANLALPTLRQLVEMARVTLGDEVLKGKRTLERLGLEGLTRHEILAFVDRDSTPATKRANRPATLAVAV